MCFIFIKFIDLLGVKNLYSHSSSFFYCQRSLNLFIIIELKNNFLIKYNYGIINSNEIYSNED